MRHVSTLLRRELAAYFLSPMAYLILLALQVLAAINFFILVEQLSRLRPDLSAIRDPMVSYLAGSAGFWIALMIVVPALTMRLLAEEQRSGTIEGLMTAPVSETEVVLAKWLAGVVMYAVLLLPYFVYLPFLYRFGRFAFDLGPVAALAVGLTTMGMMFIAVGLFFSALTKHQIVAAIATFVAMFLLVVVTLLASLQATRGPGGWAGGFQFVTVLNQAHSFATGRLDLRFVALHLSVAAFLLYLTIKVLESRRGM